MRTTIAMLLAVMTVVACTPPEGNWPKPTREYDYLFIVQAGEVSHLPDGRRVTTTVFWYFFADHADLISEEMKTTLRLRQTEIYRRTTYTNGTSSTGHVVTEENPFTFIVRAEWKLTIVERPTGFWKRIPVETYRTNAAQ